MVNDTKDSETIEGIVEDIRFQNTDTGYTVMYIDFHGDLLSVVGSVGNVAVGETVRLYGSFVVHPKYGEQFSALSCERGLPSGKSAMKKYLQSGAINSIGKKTALLIIAAFGEDVFDVLEHHPERLSEIKGISAKKAALIAEEFGQLYGVRELSLYLAEYDISPAKAAAAWKLWRELAIERIRENPYVLCHEEIGITFKKADEIAEKTGIKPDDKNRLTAGITYLLQNMAFENGHTCLPAGNFFADAARFLSVSHEEIEKTVNTGVEDKRFAIINVKDDIFLSLYDYEKAESFIARRLAALSRKHTEFDYKELIDIEEAGKGIQYAKLQRDAIANALTCGVTVLTGGPGTGKTTTLNAIISLLRQRGLSVMIAAPTGKAAKRISELTGFPAKTVHRLLEVTFDKDGKLTFVHDENNKLDCNVCIVDEMSMVDSMLFESLLRALSDDCRLVLVGDSDQLPSVGAGNILADIIKSDSVPVVVLSEIFRQAKDSDIVTNAHRIVEGEYPAISNRKDTDFFFMSRPDMEKTAETVAELVSVRLPKAYGFSPLDDIQVLCPSRKGGVGVEALNKKLQDLLNPDTSAHTITKLDGTSEKTGSVYRFRVGDKVMQVKNNYDIVWTQDDTPGTGIFNGEIGIIRSMIKRDDTIIIDYEGKLAEYTFDMTNQFELAYAATIHKSQGSEFDAVIIPILGGYDRLFCRNLLYTAVTRAKKLLIIVGAWNEVCKMVDNNLQTFRYTLLEQYLRTEDRGENTEYRGENTEYRTV
jgi:exodeoxyribonuclease V alpha subunit